MVRLKTRLSVLFNTKTLHADVISTRSPTYPLMPLVFGGPLADENKWQICSSEASGINNPSQTFVSSNNL